MPLPDASPATPSPIPRAWFAELLRTLRHVHLSTQAFCVLIAGFLALTGSSFWVSLVYSLLIGNLCSVLINLGRFSLARWRLSQPGPHPPSLHEGWPGWEWMVPVVVVGGAGGYILGAQLGDVVTGAQSAMPWRSSWRAWLAILAPSTIAALAATWFFYTRGRLAAAEAQAAQVGRLAAETQLRLLQSQLEPHMLFNTLANLRALISLDPPQAQAMLDRLIDFLRATLNASRSDAHPLSAEFDRLADYLSLMQMRMGSRLRTELSLPPELATLPVPPLLLQPLVENSIKHGLEPQRRGGLLSVQARREGDTLILTVRDDGRGLAAARIAAETDPTAPHGTGFGTTQVRERMATLYGERGRFELTDQPEGGTLATLRLPLPNA
ncbi:MAG TPA: histidine kinase [Ideonella sp.]|uniref:sensor histidine kinase n=1 Tax=Ideonella sp. TaxID=1929293 RepID=UPI002D0E3A50|nr:histidine kinase [Ideonella sp.]HSI52228.1 histidine kinase [Ideonella sp.]